MVPFKLGHGKHVTKKKGISNLCFLMGSALGFPPLLICDKYILKAFLLAYWLASTKRAYYPTDLGDNMILL